MPELEFQCPLPNGLHARPASTLAEVAARFEAEISLENRRSGASANARSVLEMVALGVKRGDPCCLRIAGADAERAARTLRGFLDNELPVCDEALPAEAPASAAALPRGLHDACGRWYAGTVVCPGIGRGRVVLIRGAQVPRELLEMPALSPDEEREKARRANAAVRATLETRLAGRPPAVEEGILRAHLSILGDVGMQQKIGAAIDTGRSGMQAVTEAAAHFAARMRESESAYVRERAIDIEDIGFQLLERMHGARLRSTQLVLAEASVVVAESLTPRQFLALDKGLLQALVLEHTGATSHAVILARSFGIPTLTGVADVRAHVASSRPCAVARNAWPASGAHRPAPATASPSRSPPTSRPRRSLRRPSVPAPTGSACSGPRCSSWIARRRPPRRSSSPSTSRRRAPRRTAR